MPQSTSIPAGLHAIPPSRAATVAPPCGYGATGVVTAPHFMQGGGSPNPANSTATCCSARLAQNAVASPCREIGDELSTSNPISVAFATQSQQAGTLGFAPSDLQSQVHSRGCSSPATSLDMHSVHTVSSNPTAHASASSSPTAVRSWAPSPQCVGFPSSVFSGTLQSVQQGSGDELSVFSKVVSPDALAQSSILRYSSNIYPFNSGYRLGLGVAEEVGGPSNNAPHQSLNISGAPSVPLTVVTDAPVVPPSHKVLPSNASCRGISHLAPHIGQPYHPVLSEGLFSASSTISPRNQQRAPGAEALYNASACTGTTSLQYSCGVAEAAHVIERQLPTSPLEQYVDSKNFQQLSVGALSPCGGPEGQGTLHTSAFTRNQGQPALSSHPHGASDADSYSEGQVTHSKGPRTVPPSSAVQGGIQVKDVQPQYLLPPLNIKEQQNLAQLSVKNSITQDQRKGISMHFPIGERTDLQMSWTSHQSLIPCSSGASFDHPSSECNLNQAGPENRRSSKKLAAPLESRAVQRRPESLPMGQGNVPRTEDDVFFQSEGLHTGKTMQQRGLDATEPLPIERENNVPLTFGQEQQQQHVEQGVSHYERKNSKTIIRKIRQSKKRSKHTLPKPHFQETVPHKKEEHRGLLADKQRLPDVQRIQQRPPSQVADPLQFLPSTNLQRAYDHFQPSNVQFNDKGQFPVPRLESRGDALLHTPEQRGLHLHSAQQPHTHIEHIHHDVVHGRPLQYEPPQKRLHSNASSETQQPTYSLTQDPVSHQQVEKERLQPLQPGLPQTFHDSAVPRAAVENLSRAFEEPHSQEQPSWQSPAFPLPSCHSMGIITERLVLPHAQSYALVETHARLTSQQQEQPWQPHLSLASVDPVPHQLATPLPVLKQNSRIGHQLSRAAVQGKSGYDMHAQSGASKAHRRVKGQRLTGRIPSAVRAAAEAKLCMHGDVPQTVVSGCGPFVLACKEPVSSTLNAADASGILGCPAVSPLTDGVQAGDIEFHGYTQGSTQCATGQLHGGAQKGVALVRKKPAMNIVRHGPQRMTGKRKHAVKSDSKNLSSPGSCSRSPSVTRIVTCVVLGFGASMPGQRAASEVSSVGLVNLGGGSCFLNVVLQCLANLQPLRDFYLHYEDMLPPRELLGRQYEMYTQYLVLLCSGTPEASRNHVRRLKRCPHQLINTPAIATSVTWELAIVINHMWRSPTSVKLLKPEGLYQACCRIMPEFDPRQMQDSDEFLRLLLDFLDAELRAAACHIPLHKALMLQMRPRKLAGWPVVKEAKRFLSRAERATAGVVSCDMKTQDADNETQDLLNVGTVSSGQSDQEELADLPTLFSVFFEGAELDKVCCLRCGRCTATLVPFKSLAVAMTQQAQEESCQYASLRTKPSTFSHLLTKVDLVECLNHHFAEDCDSLKLSSGEGYFCENCGSKQDAMKSCSLVRENLPFILCLTLKRFVRGKQTYKIWNPVRFEEYIDLSRYIESFETPVSVLKSETTRTATALKGSSAEEPIVCASPSPVAVPFRTRERLDSEPVSSLVVPSASPTASSSFMYRLVALVVHEGPAMEQGHYVCYVKHMNLDEWFRADDKVIEPADLEGNVLSACPYMLFYQRVLLDAAAATVSQDRDIDGPSFCCTPDVANNRFSGLREQITIAEGIGKGKWSMWQRLIAGLSEALPGLDGADGSVQDCGSVSSETSQCSSSRKAKP